MLKRNEIAVDDIRKRREAAEVRIEQVIDEAKTIVKTLLPTIAADPNAARMVIAAHATILEAERFRARLYSTEKPKAEEPRSRSDIALEQVLYGDES